MAKLKDVQDKIKAVKKTRQITKAMNMVAASRLRGAQGAMEKFRPYANKFAEVLGSIAQRTGEETSPLLMPREAVRHVHIVLCTSDRGLCGGFNTNLTQAANRFITERTGVSFSFTAFGKKGRDWCRKKGLDIRAEHLGIVGTTFGFNVASTSGRALIDGYLGGDYDEVHVVSAEFLTMAKQPPRIKQLLPIPPFETAEGVGETVDESQPYMPEHIVEPSPEELLSDLLPRNVYVQLFNALLETSTSEHAARMMAMDNATKACNDIIEKLTLAYNKARQAAITGELMDIVGGAEALKG